MGKLQVNGNISATGTISASSFLGNSSSATYTYQWRVSSNNPCTTATDSNTGIFNVPDSRIYWISQTGTVIDQLNQWGYILDIGTNAERHQIWMTQSSGDMAHRGGNSNGWSGSWRILLDSSNYTSYTVTKTGSGASGIWGISISGNAASASSVAWGNVSGKPSSFTPSSHTHSYIEAKNNYTFTSSTLPNSFDFGISAGFVNSDSGFGNFGSVLTVRTYSGGGGTLQLYAPYSATYGGTRLKARFGNYDSNNGNSWTTLKELAWLSDLTWSNISGKPSSFTPSSHTHNQIVSRGNVTMESGTNWPAYSGISMSQVYNNGYPTTYGNVLTLYGGGCGQLLIGWPGTSGINAPAYIRSKRDTSDANWSSWQQIATTDGSVNYSNSSGYASSAGNSDTVDGYHASSFLRKHGWWASSNSGYSADSVEDGIAFAYTSHGVPSSWGTLCTFGYGNGRDYNLQLHGTGSNQLFFRNRSSDYGQGSWQRVQVVTGWGSTNPNSAGIRGTNTGDVYYVI